MNAVLVSYLISERLQTVTFVELAAPTPEELAIMQEQDLEQTGIEVDQRRMWSKS